MKFFKFLFTCSFFFNVALAQTTSLVGKTAPPVLFQQNFGKPVKPDFYKNKVLVLDFWATWCAPCIANFPHFNELAKAYQSKDVVFGILTDEPYATSKKFFDRTKKEVIGLSLIDTTRETMKSFNVRFIPYCVVIGKDNMLKWVGSGSALTADILSAIIKDQPIIPAATDNTLTPAITTAPSKAVRPEFLFSAGLSAGITGGGSSNFKGGDVIELSRRNYTLGDVLTYLTGYSRYTGFIANDTAKLSQRVDVKFESKPDTTLFTKYTGRLIPGNPRKNMILDLLGNAMKFEAMIVRQHRKYYDLIVVDSVKLNSFRSLQKGHASFSDDNWPMFEIVGNSLNDITLQLQNSAKIIIHTNINDKNSYDLSLNVKDIGTLQKTLNFHGLSLKETSGEVNLLQVTFY